MRPQTVLHRLWEERMRDREMTRRSSPLHNTRLS